jgi:hypothetical protein
MGGEANGLEQPEQPRGTGVRESDGGGHSYRGNPRLFVLLHIRFLPRPGPLVEEADMGKEKKEWIKELGIDILTGVILGAMLSFFLYIFLIRMSQIGV